MARCVRSPGKWWGVILEAPDGPALARFYAALLDWPVTHEEAHYAVISPAPGSYLGFQSSPAYVPPVWPPADGQQQSMMHVDVEVDDLDGAVAEAVELGATVSPHQYQDSVGTHRLVTPPAPWRPGVRLFAFS